MRKLWAALAAALCTAQAPVSSPASQDQASSSVDLKALLAAKPAPLLSAYRLFTDAGAKTPSAGVTPYALNTPLFSDYAEKSRFLYLPPGTKARYRPTGALDLPVGATLIKTFAYPADFRRPDEKVRKLETRLLVHRRSGWVAYAYVWNEAQSEAVLKRAGARIDVSFIDAHGQGRELSYRVPNQNQCKECHSLSGRIAPIGVKARNLNGDFAYPEGRENQLAHWTRTGMLAAAPDPAAAPRTAVWDDPREPLEARARAYLDGNCGHCHNPRGMASNTGLWLDLEEQKPGRLGIGKRPAAAGKGAGELEFDLAPGQPDASILTYRMASEDPGVMMPELGRSLVHEEGLALVRAYIASLPPKPH